MNTNAIEILHDIHTATNDVLQGYREMTARAEPEIQSVIRQLTDMHQQHASEQEFELARLRDSGKDDSSFQGTINKAVVIMRDWVSQLNHDVLPAVRQGEESLRDKYYKALEDDQLQGHPFVTGLLQRQLGSICTAIEQLPK